MKKIGLVLISYFLIVSGSCLAKGSEFKLPDRGLCAHRGAMQTHPENTIPAFNAAIKAGAHMIEFDVWFTKDNEMVVLHDSSVDRTTNGKGKISDFTLSEIKKLDAGSWKAPEFAGERIPTLEEVLNVMPYNIWLNIHIKGLGELSVKVARVIAVQGRLHQAFLACNAAAAAKAREAVPEILICNMERQGSASEYVAQTIRTKAEFIQLAESDYPEFAEDVRSLKKNGIRVNYFGTDSPDVIRMLFETGVDFPLVNDIIHTMDVARELNIEPVKPLFNIKHQKK
jgi:glycerophosphoryl diester phosphodiesterase